MPVAYNTRSTPLSINASNTLAASIVLAYDFTGVDSAHTAGVPWKYAGATQATLNLTGTETVTTVNGEPGIVPGVSSYYDRTSTTDYGMQVGSGDFTIALRLTTPATLPSTSNYREILRISGTAGTALTITFQENPSNGWYFSAAGSVATPLGSVQGAVTYGASKTIMVFVQRISGVTTVFTQDATAQTNAVVRYAAGAAATATLDSTWAARLMLNFGNTVATTPAMQAFAFWNTGLATTDISTVGKDFYATQTNGAAPDAITLASPAANATIPTSTTLSGTYTGTTPTGVDAQFGANAWVSGTSMTIGSGSWTGSFTLAAGGPSSLTVREANQPAVTSAATTGVTVTATNSIAFTTPPTTADGAVDFRLFQRDSSNQASVRVTGTYTGSPTSIEYQWGGGAWTVLEPTPSGGVFDKTIVLVGPGQGALAIRFANNTSVTASLASVGVGDLYLVAGQSNHVGGGAGTYVPASAPAGHPSWKATILDKTGRWRENVETSTDPFSKTTNASIYPAASATYAAQAASATAYNSYFGQLATTIMAYGVPVAFIPCALGSTSISNWAVSTATNTLYGAMLARAQQVGSHKAVLWWQGEADTGLGTTNSSYQSSLNAIINDWCVTRFPSAKWVLMNLNATGNAAGSGGTSSTDTGFNAIHAAIASVGASNAHVAAVADMNGTFSGSVHYASSSEITAVSNSAFAALNSAYAYSVTLASSASLTLTDAAGTPWASLTGLKWAFFDQVTPNLFAAPVAKGTAGTTNASGVMTVSIAGTSLATGATGWLAVTDSDGTTTQTPAAKAFGGPVAVA